MGDKLFVNGRFLHQPITGVERYGREILRGFDRAGYPYQVLEPPSTCLPNKLTQHIWEQILLPGRTKDRGVLWSPANSGPVFAENHVITLHDVGVFPHPEWFSTMYRFWKQQLIPRITRRANKIITVSEFSKQVICRYLDLSPKKVLVVYNGVDRDRFKPADSLKIQQVLKKYSISQPYCFALGSMDPRKNFPALVEAWSRCIKQESVKGYSLVIAGGSNVNFSRIDINNSRSGIRHLGYVTDDELSPLYSGATGFLYPSLFEGFGLPVVEAMACGTPVLTSDGTALSEVAGDAAITINPESVESIKEGILQLLESPSLRNDLINRGFERVNRYDWNKAATLIYNNIIE